METFFSRWGIGEDFGTANFFDLRTKQLIENYEFYKYNPGQFSQLAIWKQAVIMLRRLEPKGSLF